MILALGWPQYRVHTPLSNSSGSSPLLNIALYFVLVHELNNEGQVEEALLAPSRALQPLEKLHCTEVTQYWPSKLGKGKIAVFANPASPWNGVKSILN